jgi:hypothetical protein
VLLPRQCWGRAFTRERAEHSQRERAQSILGGEEKTHILDKMEHMAYKPFVATVKGSSPECFMLGEIDLENLPSNFMNTSDFLSEEDFRKMLAERNIQPEAIEALVQQARQNAI